LTSKRWLVEADTGESIRARYVKRAHRLLIRVDYTPREISFHYVDSAALGYEHREDGDYIHPNANVWLRQLGDEVHLKVQAFAFEREPADVVPVEPAPDTVPPPT
jgi:hypothetical protein